MNDHSAASGEDESLILILLSPFLPLFPILQDVRGAAKRNLWFYGAAERIKWFKALPSGINGLGNLFPTKLKQICSSCKTTTLMFATLLLC